MATGCRNFWTSTNYQSAYHFTVSVPVINSTFASFRLTDISTASATNGIVGTNGTDRVDNFTVTADPPATIITVTSTADSGPGTLRAALASAVDGDTIHFWLTTPATITLTSGELLVNKCVTIAGPDAGNLVVNGNHASRVFYIAPATTVTISGLTITNGDAGVGSGGGIYNDHATLTVSNCTVSGNSAGNSFSGGGIFNNGSGFPGGAILTVANSTLSGNSAGGGGGIFNNGQQGGGASLHVVNSTLSGNSATSGGGIDNFGFEGVATVEIGNTILKAGAAGENIVNWSGWVTSRGYNLSSDGGVRNVTGGTGDLNATGDQINTDPMLGPLQYNGGPNFTHALLPGSPAIDQGKRNTIPALASDTDQRGLPRPSDGPIIANAACGDGSDIGAFEAQIDPLAIACPANVTSNTAPGQCSAVVTYTTPAASATCAGATVSCYPASGLTFPLGFTTVTCAETDDCGNTRTCRFYVTVVDNQNPTITCPADIATNTAPGQCYSAALTFAPASDNCPGVTASCSPPSGSTFPVGPSLVNCTATDGSGNTATCGFFVTVRGAKPPTITCQGNIVTDITPNCTAIMTWPLPTATANCGATIRSVACKPASGSTFKTGTTPVTCSAIDYWKNTNTCSFTVTVLNTTPLTFSVCPTNFTVNTCGPKKAVTFKKPVVADACLSVDSKVIVTSYCVPRSGTVFPMGTTTVNCHAQDKSGNTAECSFDVTLADLTPPSITKGVKNQCVMQDCDGLVSYAGPRVATDTCSVVTIDCTPASGTMNFYSGVVAKSNTVTCIATDTSGNTATNRWNIMVNRRLTPKWLAPVNGNDLCLIADTDAEPTNTFTVGEVVTNQVKVFDLNNADVTAEMTGGVVTIQFSLRDQVSPTSSTLITNVTPLVPRLGRGTKGTDLKPVGKMKYIPGGNYFEFDVITTNANWNANTLGDSTFYRATVTVTPPKPFCTPRIVGTGAVRLESTP
jgi:hypothetical protein